MQDAQVTSLISSPRGQQDGRAAAIPEVTILMGVYNGGAYLAEQLDSIANQDHDRWRLIASDDGSTDASHDVLERFAKQFGQDRVEIRHGPQCGFAQNYLSMIRSLGSSPGWITFSDQDDVWLPHRLSSGVEALLTVEPSRGAIHCSRSYITRQDLSEPRLSPRRPKPPSFRNALVQNIASGNTILANPIAGELIVAATRQIETVIAHDWWIYQIVTGGGGRVLHEDTPGILYRQHEENAIGANDSIAARLHRIKMMLSGKFKEWNDVNLMALQQVTDCLTPEARSLVTGMIQLRGDPSPLSRLATIRKLGLYRQTIPSQFALHLSAVLGKI